MSRKTNEEKRKYHREYYNKTKHTKTTTQAELVKETNKIISLYVNEEKSAWYIAKLYCVDKTLIYRILIENNIPRRSRNVAHKMTSGRKNTRWKGYEEISGAYWRTVTYGATTARNLTFSITIQQAWNLFLKQDRRCAITGIKLMFAEFNKDFVEGHQTASLDRIDSSKGYALDNVWWVHKRVNMMKQSLSMEEFKYWCKMVTEYNKGIKNNHE